MFKSRCYKPTLNGFCRQPTQATPLRQAWHGWLALAALLLSLTSCNAAPPLVDQARLAPAIPTAAIPLPKVAPSATPAPTSTTAPHPINARPTATAPLIVLAATPAPTARPPTATATPRVRFAVIGDFGWEGPDAAAVATLVRGWAPDFIVTTGDNNYPAGEARTIDQNIGQYYHAFIAPYRGAFGPGAAVNRFFPALGNHDFQTQGGAPYLDFFALPGNERYYSVIQGPVDFFFLHSTPGEPDGVAPNSRQAVWLRETLSASRACWKLVVMHHPPYSSAHHGSSGWMQWPYKAWGADAVLAGHDHVYERLLVDGLVYFTNGLGGAPRYAFNNPLPGSQARYNAGHGAMRVEGEPGTLRFAFVTRAGEVIDSYEMVKTC